MDRISKERLTKISNYTMERMLNYYNDLQIKFFFLVLNKAISGHYARASDGENYRNIISSDDRVLEIPTSFIKEYGSSNMYPEKTNNKHPNSMSNVLRELATLNLEFIIDGNKTIMPVLKKAMYIEERASFIITINDCIAEYLILIDSDYSKVDLEVLKLLHGKYEIGMYFIYCKYNKFRKGKKQAFNINTISDMINCKIDNGVMMGKIRKAIKKLNDILNKNNNTENIDYMKIETAKYNNKITGMSIEFE